MVSIELYHISMENNDGVKFEPRVPLHRMNGEDPVTDRVCFAPTIEGALKAIDLLPYNEFLPEVFFFVHMPVNVLELINDGAIYEPSEGEVPDVKETGEVWCMEPVEMRCVSFAHAYYHQSKGIVVEDIYTDPDPRMSIEELIGRYRMEDKYNELGFENEDSERYTF